jgi:hypothetical protein
MKSLPGLIAQRYPSPEWVTFFEVSNGTGFNARRRADAVALGVWPSRGHSLIGFEFKEDRRDWLREKDDPSKADVIAAHCDTWYLVIGNEKIAKVEELPEPWGLLVASEDRERLLLKKDAVPFPDRDKSVIRRSFAAAMLRKVGETTVPKVELERIVEARMNEAVDRTREGQCMKHLEERVRQLQDIIDEFELVTGVKMDGWRGPTEIAKAVNALLSFGDHRQSLENAHRVLLSVAKNMEEAIASWPITV